MPKTAYRSGCRDKRTDSGLSYRPAGQADVNVNNLPKVVAPSLMPYHTIIAVAVCCCIFSFVADTVIACSGEK